MNRQTPDWSDSPDWAQYLAQNSDGSWWWHEMRPTPVGNGQPSFWHSSGARRMASGGWLQSLQKRRDWAEEILKLRKETE